MRRAVEHLAELGHQRITYVAGPEASWADGMRWRSLREAATELRLQARRIGPYPPTVAGGGARAATELTRHPSSAVIAYNDLPAIGLIRTLIDLGVQVPADVSVIGFDNIFAAELVTPPLTTVVAPLRAMGVTAVQNLLAIVRGRPSARGGTGEPALPSGGPRVDRSAQAEQHLTGLGNHQGFRVSCEEVETDERVVVGPSSIAVRTA